MVAPQSTYEISPMACWKVISRLCHDQETIKHTKNKTMIASVSSASAENGALYIENGEQTTV